MALSTLCLYRHGSHPIVGLARGPHAQEVVVTVQGDGVLCYSADTQVGSMFTAWPSRPALGACTPPTAWKRQTLSWLLILSCCVEQ